MNKLIIILAILVNVGAVFFYLNRAPERRCPNNVVEVGMYTRETSLEGREQDLEMCIDNVLLFQKIDEIQYSEVSRRLNQGYGVILNLEFFDDHANLRDIAEGKYDEELRELAQAARNDGRTIWFRTLHEFNGDWYNWAAIYPENNVEDFIPAWRHVVDVLREEDAPFKYQLNYSRYNANYGSKKVPFATFWPGDAWVDMVVITNYNRAYTSPDHQYWHSFSEDFEESYKQVTSFTKKPIGVAEMSSTSFYGDKPQWITEAFASLAHDYPLVSQVTWFAYNRPIDGMVWDWDLNSEAEKSAFTTGIKTLQEARKEER